MSDKVIQVVARLLERGHATTIIRWEKVGGTRIRIRMATALC